MRDRDRLRGEHLQRLGWRFHRIWSTNWFRDPDSEVTKLQKAYQAAVNAAMLAEPEPEPPVQVPPPAPEPKPAPEPEPVATPAGGTASQPVHAALPPTPMPVARTRAAHDIDGVTGRGVDRAQLPRSTLDQPDLGGRAVEPP